MLSSTFIDDLWYVQQSREEMDVLFTLLAERYNAAACSSPAVEWTLNHLEEHKRANSDDPNITGMLITSRKLKTVSEPVLPLGRLMAERFHESPSYHECWNITESIRV